MKVLVINCGSSSIKFQLLDMQTETVLLKGGVERIGMETGIIKFKCNGEEVVLEKPVPDHNDGIATVLNFLVKGKFHVIDSLDDIGAVGHRVVHGGEMFHEAALINDRVIAGIKACIPIAPLHNPVNLAGIAACHRLMPNTPQVACFDTAFHQTIPQEAFLYGLPYSMYEKYGIRRYGFHGLSHKYVSLKAASLMGKDIKDLKLITCHLGNGASITAIRGGKSIDTSMGFTPLEGLVMGTRSGEIDPAVVSFLMDNEDMTAKQVSKFLNNQSGMLGLSGISSDFRDLEEAYNKGDERAKVALAVYNYTARKYIGSYIMALEGLDAVIFTAGVGENSPIVRNMIASHLEFMGAKINHRKNETLRGTFCFSEEGCLVQLWTIPTNEELMIAQETVAVCAGGNK